MKNKIVAIVIAAFFAVPAFAANTQAKSNMAAHLQNHKVMNKTEVQKSKKKKKVKTHKHGKKAKKAKAAATPAQ